MALLSGASQAVVPNVQALTSLAHRPRAEPLPPTTHYRRIHSKENPMRSGLLWFIGVPIPLILLLAYCSGHL